MKKIMKVVLGALVATTILIGCTKGVVDTKEKEEIVELYPVLNVEKGLYGYVNKNGEYEIEPKFADANMFKDGYAVVNMGEDKDINLINKSGNLILPEDNEFNQLIIKKDAIIASKIDGKNKLFDLKGKEIINSNYDFVHVNDSGLIEVYLDNEVGIINSKGKEILPIEYDRVFISGDSIYWNKDNIGGVSNLEGKEKLRIENSNYIMPFGDKLLISRNNENYKSIHSKDGKVIIEGIHEDGIYREVYELQEGLMATCKNGKWGYISESGEEKIPFIYDEALTFVDGYARIKQGDNYGIINTNGDVVIEPKYSDIKYKVNNTVETSEGKSVMASYVVDDRVIVKEGEVEYIVDLSGKRVSGYYNTIEYVGNVIVATLNSEKSTRQDGISVMLINKDGEKITKEYAMIGYMPYDLMIANEEDSDEGYIINSKDEVVNSNLYGAFGMPYSYGYDSFVTRKGSSWAVISIEGRELLEFDEKVETVTIYDKGLYYLKYKDGNVDLVNETGTSILK